MVEKVTGTATRSQEERHIKGQKKVTKRSQEKVTGKGQHLMCLWAAPPTVTQNFIGNEGGKTRKAKWGRGEADRRGLQAGNVPAHGRRESKGRKDWAPYNGKHSRDLRVWGDYKACVQIKRTLGECNGQSDEGVQRTRENGGSHRRRGDSS